MNQREKQALDRHITGNYGEDQMRDTCDDLGPRRYKIKDKRHDALDVMLTHFTLHDLIMEQIVDLSDLELNIIVDLEPGTGYCVDENIEIIRV